MNHQEYVQKCDPEKILTWLIPYTSHEHLGVDIKEVSLDKFLAVAPDVYVMAAMLRSLLLVAAEQKDMGEYGQEEKMPFKPFSELTEEEKTDEELAKRQYFLAGLRRGRDMALIEMANRITYAARDRFDAYRLENSEYDPTNVVDKNDMLEVD